MTYTCFLWGHGVIRVIGALCEAMLSLEFQRDVSVINLAWAIHANNFIATLLDCERDENN